MNKDEKILETLMSITWTANTSRLDFKEKLQRILSDVVSCMGTERGSIMLVKGRKNLEVAAATSPHLIGVKQSIDQDSPSSWVVKNKKLLSVDKTSDRSLFSNRFDHYKKDAFLLVPILSQNKVIGIISVTEKMGSDRFSKADQTILLNLAGHVISALEKNRLAESLRRSKKNLNDKNIQLRKLEKIRTELFNMLIHDLKGPISEVMANIDILSYVTGGENLEYVEAARSGCDTLYRMITDLLDIARLEDRSLKLYLERIDPADLIKEAASRIYGLSRSRDLTVVEKVPSDGGNIYLNADRGILLRVLQNLLTNAIQFSPAGEIIEIGYIPVDPSQIQFFVKDKGPGIPPEFREAIFDKFMQVSSRKDGRKFTTGLGLTFCKMAVEEHKGKIYAESDEGQGSRFVFFLPLSHP